MNNWFEATNSVEPGQTTHMCMLAWLYASGKEVTPAHAIAHIE